MVFPSSLSSPPPPPWLLAPGLGPGLVDVGGCPGSLRSVAPGVSHDDLRRPPQPCLDVRPGVGSVLVIVPLTVSFLHLFPSAVVPGRFLSRPALGASAPGTPETDLWRCLSSTLSCLPLCLLFFQVALTLVLLVLLLVVLSWSWSQHPAPSYIPTTSSLSCT